VDNIIFNSDYFRFQVFSTKDINMCDIRFVKAMIYKYIGPVG
jgi:hypothetical protein